MRQWVALQERLAKKLEDYGFDVWEARWQCGRGHQSEGVTAQWCPICLHRLALQRGIPSTEARQVMEAAPHRWAECWADRRVAKPLVAMPGLLWEALNTVCTRWCLEWVMNGYVVGNGVVIYRLIVMRRGEPIVTVGFDRKEWPHCRQQAMTIAMALDWLIE